MWIINYIQAANDANGNPRRGWHCILMDSGYSVWVEEGYEGRGALERFKEGRKTYEAYSYNVPLKEYRFLKKWSDEQF